jgi:hypothetical protein
MGEEPEVADAHETFGQHMQKEAAQELDGGEGHPPLLLAVGIVLPTEGDVLPVKGQESMLGDGDAMGVAAQVGKDLRRSPKGRLGIDHPVMAMKAARQFTELLLVGQGGAGSCAA